jgi:hypothetical protein
MIRTICMATLRFTLLATLTFMSGCAPVSHQVDLIYHPTTHLSGGNGHLYIAADSDSSRGTASQVLWVIGRIESPDGTTIGRVTSDISPGDRLRDAFEQELESTGYQVAFSDQLAREHVPGISLDKVDFKVTEVPSLLTVNVTCNIDVTVGIWKSGEKVAARTFSVRASDSFSRENDWALNEIVQRALSDLMATAVPEVIAKANG